MLNGIVKIKYQNNMNTYKKYCPNVFVAQCEDLADEVSAYYDIITKDWKIYPSGQTIEVTEWRPIEWY